MKVIKAFYKDEKGYYCQPGIEKFYYEVGHIYKVPQDKVKMCVYGFHTSPNIDISNTVLYYTPSEKVYYGIVEIAEEDIVDRDNDKLAGSRIKILKFLPHDQEVLMSYDKTGEWIAYAGRYWKEFDYKRGLEKLLEVDTTGKWIAYVGECWKEFDYKRGLEKLLEVDTTGKWIAHAGKYWKEFDYKYAFEKLLEIDTIGQRIAYAGKEWKEFDYKRGLERLLEVDTTGECITYAGKHWKEFDFDYLLNYLKK